MGLFRSVRLIAVLLLAFSCLCRTQTPRSSTSSIRRIATYSGEFGRRVTPRTRRPVQRPTVPTGGRPDTSVVFATNGDQSGEEDRHVKRNASEDDLKEVMKEVLEERKKVRGQNRFRGGVSLPVGPDRPDSSKSRIELPPGVEPPSPPNLSGELFPNPGVFAGPRPPSPPPPQPPAPPPVTTDSTLTFFTSAKPPSPPPSKRDVVDVTGITCLKTDTSQSFNALVTLPEGFEAVPVFEDRPMVDPTTNTLCRVIPTQPIGMFRIIVFELDPCGIRECTQADGEIWLCLTLRLPLVSGVKLPEDEIVDIRCRPQERTADDIHVLTVSTANVNPRPPTVFEGDGGKFQCEIGLFKRVPGTKIFSTMVDSNMPLELGEEVQLRSIVGGDDGWQYSRITEILIQRNGGERERSSLNTAVLVFSDGCRNPRYKVIAPNHPQRDRRNTLVNNFNMRVFMFQDMVEGDSLTISARVIGCLTEEDCEPTLCPDDNRSGYGRRRRGVQEYEYSWQTSPFRHTRSTENNSTTGWERNLSIRVKVPDGHVHQESVRIEECRLYLFVSLGVACLFCLISIGFVAFVFTRTRRRLKKSRCNSSSTLGAADRSVGLPPRMVRPPAPVEDNRELAENLAAHLPTVSVPNTVRHRKREVNAELLSMFDGPGMYSTFNHPQYPPGMLNYYGYVVLPQKAVEKNEKKSLRALKRQMKDLSARQRSCSCSQSSSSCGAGDTSTSDEDTSRCSDHTSIIRIGGDSDSSVTRSLSVTSLPASAAAKSSSMASPPPPSFSSASAISNSWVSRPTPRPRTAHRDDDDQHVYSEIRQVMV
ncbi:uncharacterized protein LOC143019722 isoform X2 [Oratosquilla oratoria]|uniref:uncharacterized protein LOC143019722 isoform X2 n=1 Tax=Oratosquilla oratoria TaxID=337810 RepID=UPI003F773029